VSHWSEHALPEHVGLACNTDVVQTLPHPLQLFGSVVVLTHVDPHRVGVVPEHPEVQAYVEPDPEHRGSAVGHVVPHVPQLLVVLMAVSHPWDAGPLQCA
jgi:hypothetical protein